MTYSVQKMAVSIAVWGRSLNICDNLLAFFLYLNNNICASVRLYNQGAQGSIVVKAIYYKITAERTPRFGRGVARGGVGVEQWGVCR
jgi:hypothetical protein